MRPISLMVLLAVGCATAEPEDAGPSSGTLTVLTYNVAGLPTGLSSAEAPTPERMEAIAPFLDDYDLVGIQEDFTPEGHELLVAEATHPVRHWFDATVADDRAYGSGLTLLSRAGEQVDYEEEHYTACNGVLDGASDCLASKGWQAIRLRLGTAELDVYNTHHEAGGGAEDEAARTVQVDQVVAAMESWSGDRAILFMGDTNMRYTDPPDAVELEKYVDQGLADACDAVDCGDRDRIDRFLFRSSAELDLAVAAWSVEEQLVDGEGRPLSDHEGVAIELSWDAAVR